MGDNPRSNLSQTQILQKVYSPDDDRLRVDAQYTANIAGDLEVAIDASTDSIKIKNGNNSLDVNNDGSINVNIVNSGPIPDSSETINSSFNTISSVASGSETLICSYTVSTETAKLQRCEFGGENIAVYNLYKNSTLIARTRTFYGSLTETMTFLSSQDSGLDLIQNDFLELKVIHTKTALADFEGRIQALEIS